MCRCPGHVQQGDEKNTPPLCLPLGKGEIKRGSLLTEDEI